MNAPSPSRSKRHGQPLLARRTAMCLLGLASTMVGSATQGPLVPYFDAVDVAGPPPTNFVLRVTEVVPEGPAALAGVQAGDLIAGFDGMRVRSSTDYSMVSRLADEHAPMRFDLVRDGAWLRLTVAHPLGDRYALLETTDQTSPLVPRLRQSGVRIEPLPTHDDPFTEGGGAAPLEDAPYGFGPRSWFEVNHGPGRVRESMMELVEARRDGDGPWIEALIRAWMLLLREDYAAAAGALAPVTSRPTHPFLDAYARFLAAVAERQGVWRAPDDWRLGGVDETFFAMCYPYPTLPRVRHQGFSDPVLQNAFDRSARLRSPQDHDAVHTLAKRFLRWDLESAAENYVTHVATALVGLKQHGGWPYRSSLIHGTEDRREVLGALKKRFEEEPDDRLLTSFALLFPASKTGDLDTLREALETIHQAGTDYAAVANRTLRWAASNWTMDEGEWAAVWTDVDQKYCEPPAVYRHLADRTPILAARLSLGFFNHEDYMDDVAMFASRNPWHIRQGLVDPDDGCSLELLLDAAGDGMSMSEPARVDAFRLLCSLMARSPDPVAYRQLVELARSVPLDEAFRGLHRVAVGNDEHARMGAIRRITRASASWIPLLEAADADALKTAMAAASRIAAGGSAREECRQAFPKAGTASAAIVLAAAAARAGDRELSRELASHAASFHFVTYEGGTRATALWAVRDLSAADGFLSETSRYLDVCLNSEDRRAYLLAARHSLRKGDADAAAEYLATARTAAASVKLGPTTLVWDGERLPLAAFEARLAAALEKQRPATP